MRVINTSFNHLFIVVFVFVATVVQAQNLPLYPGLSEPIKGSMIKSKYKILPKINQDLLSIHSRYSSLGNNKLDFSVKNPAIQVYSNKILIDFVAFNDASNLKTILKDYGLEKAVKHGKIVSGWLPIDLIPKLAEIDELHMARPAYVMTHVGSTTSQGDMAIMADIARSSFSVDGTGILVGTLSDSYDCLSGAAADVISQDLPSGITVLADEAGCASGTDEGRAMMQIIADVAPGADQAFHTAFGGIADFASGIIELATVANADVIVDDVLYLAEPMFQDGVIAQAVDTVTALGVSYFSSAGNNGSNSYESAFNGSGAGIFNVNSDAHDFDPGVGSDPFQEITVAVGDTLIVILQWDSPFFSVSGAPGTANDIDIFLTDEPPTVGLASSQDDNIGGDAIEILSFTNDGSNGTTFNIVIENFAGVDPGLIKYVINSGTVNEYATNSSTSYGHANALGAESVGAAAYFNTPDFGVTPPVLNSFSSRGGTPILFDLNGNSIMDLRQKPEIVCADGGNNTFFGGDYEPDGFPNFFGTSAAAPHAAGIAALILDFDSSITQANLMIGLETTAIDMNSPGPDDLSGYGLCQADLALESFVNTEISVTKTAAPNNVPEGGGLVSFTVRVDNLGNTNVTLNSLLDDTHADLDSQGTCALTQAINVGGFYQCSYSVMVNGNAGDSQASTVTASAQDSFMNSTNANDSTTVTVTDVNPTIFVNFTPNPTSVPEPGAMVDFTVQINNTSTAESVELTALSNDVYGDLNGQGDCSVPQTIAASGSLRCVFSVMISGIADDTPTSTVTATAQDDELNSTNANDSASVTVTNINPTITVNHTADPITVPEPGGMVSFTVKVNNTSTFESVELIALLDNVYGDLDGQGTCSVPQTIATSSSFQCVFSGMVNGNADDTQTSVVTATAQDVGLNSTNADDFATVTVTNINPTITLNHTANPITVAEPGGMTSFTVQVNNTGTAESVELTALMDDVYGDLNGQGTCSLPQTIAVSGLYQCVFSAAVTGNAGTSQTSMVTATAQDDELNTANGNDSATVNVTDVLPTISIDNTANPTEVAEPGAMVGFTVQINNTGTSEPVELVALMDDVYGDLNGQGTCSVPQAITESGSYRCEYSGMVTGNTNDSQTSTVTATAQDDELNSTNANNSAIVTVTDVLPAISVNNTANPILVVEPGGMVSFTVQVNNTSTAESVELTALMDDVYGDLDGQGTCSVPQTIAASDTYQCVFSGMVTGNLGDSQTSTVTATAQDDDSNSIVDNDTATVTVTDEIPTITLNYTANPTMVAEPGGMVSFTIQVNNTSTAESVELTALMDDFYGDLNGKGDCTVPQTIAVSGSYQCAFSEMVTGNADDSQTSTVTATVQDDELNTANANDSGTVTVADVLPTISISNSANPTEVAEPGGMVSFTVQVNNTGTAEAVDLIALVDNAYGNLNGQGTCSAPQTIAASSSYQCSFMGMVTGNANDSQTSTVTATVQDDELNSTNANNSAIVTVTDVLPTISVNNTANPILVVEPGGMVNFTVQVNNTSTAESVELTALMDDVYGGLDGQGTCSVPQTIAASGSYQCSFMGMVSGNADDSQTSTVTAAAQDDDSNSIVDNDSATVTVTDEIPAMTLNYTANPTMVAEPGDMVSFTVQVNNTGMGESVELTALMDDFYGDLNGKGDCTVPQTIAVSGSYQCAFSEMVTGNADDSQTSTVTATAQDDELNTANANDSATVTVADVLPTISISNSANPINIPEPGGTVSFTVQVNNTGFAESVELTSLIDDVYGNLNGEGTCVAPQTIAANGLYQCVFSGTFSGEIGDSQISTITATAQDDELNTSNASDSVTVTVIDLIFANGFEE